MSFNKPSRGKKKSVTRAARKKKITDHHKKMSATIELNMVSANKTLPTYVDTAPQDGSVWTSHHDPISQRSYYVNKTTGRTTWTENISTHVPIAPSTTDGVWKAHHDAASQRTYYANSKTGRTTWTDHGGHDVVQEGTPVPQPQYSNGWCRHRNPATGDPFYEHTVTGKTQWHAPDNTDFQVRGSDKFMANPMSMGTGPSEGEGEVDDLCQYDGLRRRSDNTWTRDACGRHQRCCCSCPGLCGCCPGWCVWPCCARQVRFFLNVYAEGSTRQVRTAVLPGQTFTPLCLSLLWPGTRAGGWVCVAGAVVCHVCVLDRHGGAIDVVVGLRSKGRRCKLFQDRSNPRRGHDHRGVSHQRARAIGQPRPIRVAECRCGDFQSRGHRFRVGKEAPCFVCVTAFVLLTVVDGG